MPMARASVVVAALFAAAEMRTVVSVATAIASIVGLVQVRRRSWIRGEKGQGRDCWRVGGKVDDIVLCDPW